MAAVRPPNNTAGIPLPANAARPSTLQDVSNSLRYLEKLVLSRKSEHPQPATEEEIGAAAAYSHRLLHDHIPLAAEPPWVQRLTGSIERLTGDVRQIRNDLAAVKTDITNLRADVAALQQDVQSVRTDITDLKTDDIGPIKNDVAATKNDVAATKADVTTIGDNITRLLRLSEELPALLANSSAGLTASLYNPSAAAGGDWAGRLAPPNPRSRDDLKGFTAQECINSADNLGLPRLPHNANVDQRRRQIAIRLGVSI